MTNKPKRPARDFWMPLRFDVHDRDTLRLNADQERLYTRLLRTYWQLECDLSYDDVPTALKCKPAQVDDLFDRVAELKVLDGKVHHEIYRNEYDRALKRAERGSKGASARWGEEVSNA